MKITYDKTPEQLAHEELRRAAIEAAALKIEEQSYISEAYQKAQKTFARLVRTLKP